MMMREALCSDLDDVLSVEREAFGSDEEAILVQDLLEDASARPLVSLLAFMEERPVGHILFTKAHLEPEVPLTISILAPLAVVPAAQKQGVGSELVAYGLRVLSKSGVDLVFVFGIPAYYPRFGFNPAGGHGFDAPYPIPENIAAAWMVQSLKPNVIGAFSGKVICADTLNKPEYWRP